MKFLPTNLSFNNVLGRFYLMIAATIILGFMGQWILAAIVGYALGLSAILGLSAQFGPPKPNAKVIANSKETTKVISLENTTVLKKAS